MAARDPASRFGDISPAFAAAFGAKIDLAFMPGARKAQARAMAADARRPAAGPTRAVLPSEIPTQRALPASRVRTAVVITSAGNRWR